MALPLYLAMTAAEMRANSPLPERIGYMACHFSPYGTGLANRPKALPDGALLILNDRTPVCGHDPTLITHQLSELVEACHCSGVLLDFQRAEVDETSTLSKILVNSLPCPVGVSDVYAQKLDCPVFLPPVPLDVPLCEHIAPWEDREIWLDTALDAVTITLTQKGYSVSPLLHPETDSGFSDRKLHCHYTTHTADDTAQFTLFRTREDLQDLLKEAALLSITRAIGLWQELRGT